MNDKSDDKTTNKPRSWIERLTSFIAREPQNQEQLMDILRDAEERGVVGAEMLSMIECILQVSDMQVRDVMVPKSQMVVIEKDFNLQELLPVIIESSTFSLSSR